MTGELQYPRQGVHEISATEYCFSSAARIRRALLEHTVDGRDFHGEIFKSLNLRGDESILNIGTGDGLDEVRLAVEFGHKGRIVGVDLPTPGEEFSDRFILAEMDLANAGVTNVEFRPGDAERLPFDDSEFEVVMWINSGYYFRHVTRALLETQRVLMPGGTYQNITNGLANKPKHHELVREIKASLGVTSHKPLSASFNLQASQRVIQPLFEQVEPYLQETEYALNRDEVYFLEHSVDTYRSGLSEKQVGRWIEVRKRVIRERVIPEMDANGFWADNVQRGGGKYRNSYKNVNKRATLWPRTLR